MWLFFPLPFLALFLLLPLWMSQSVADVSTSCDILTESINERRVEDLDRSPRLLALELALKNLNSCQGLGFVIGGTVLDKKRLRTLYLSVAGFFSTVIPLLVAFTSSDSQEVRYAMFSNSPSVYAFRAATATFEETQAFCESLWMSQPSIHSEEEVLALARWAGVGAMMFVGAERGEDGLFRWQDGSDWVVPADQRSAVHDIDAVGKEDTLYVQLQSDGTVKWKASASPKGALCFAPSLANLQGAIPAVRNLGQLSSADGNATAVIACSCCP
eukprot:COSAG04_NODE_2078_length_4851_cov_2.384891_3_plen_272_part_00